MIRPGRWGTRSKRPGRLENRLPGPTTTWIPPPNWLAKAHLRVDNLGSKGVSLMRRVVLLALIAFLGISAGHTSPPAAVCAINDNTIEACTSPMFLRCVFNY